MYTCNYCSHMTAEAYLLERTVGVRTASEKFGQDLYLYRTPLPNNSCYCSTLFQHHMMAKNTQYCMMDQGEYQWHSKVRAGPYARIPKAPPSSPHKVRLDPTAWARVYCTLCTPYCNATGEYINLSRGGGTKLIPRNQKTGFDAVRAEIIQTL